MAKNTIFCFYKKVIICGLMLSFLCSAAIAAEVNGYNEAGKLQLMDQVSIEVEKTRKLEISDCTYIVKGVRASRSNGQKAASDGNKYICINLDIENSGDTEQQITSFMMFKLIDSNRQQYNIVLPEGLDSINGILSPHKVMSGNIWFEVPETERCFQFAIRSFGFNGETGVTNINSTEFSDTANIVIDNNYVQNSEENKIMNASGRKVQIGNLVFTLKNISATDINIPDSADEGYKLLNIGLSVKNKGVKEEQITSVMVFKLTDTDGRVYNIDLHNDYGVNGLIKPNKELNGNISFRVRTGSSGLKLEIKPWVTSPMKTYINLSI